ALRDRRAAALRARRRPLRPLRTLGALLAPRARGAEGLVSALLEVRALRKEFPIRSGLLRRQVGTVKAVDGVDLDLERGETLALVGESGSGKTTLGRSIVRLVEPTSGSVRLEGEDFLALPPEALRR